MQKSIYIISLYIEIHERYMILLLMFELRKSIKIASCYMYC